MPFDGFTSDDALLSEQLLDDAHAFTLYPQLRAELHRHSDQIVDHGVVEKGWIWRADGLGIAHASSILDADSVITSMRNVWILTLAQGFAACGTIILVTFGGIVGTRLAPEPYLATLPLSLSVLGIASSSLPAALLMQRIGRKPAFIGSALVAATAALVIAWSIATANFVTLCAAAFFIGGNMAFVQQYRFAAMEFVPAELAGRAVSTVMIGTLGAAIAGPALGQLAADLGGWPQFTGSFVVLSGLCLCATVVLLKLPFGTVAARTESTRGTSIARLLLKQDYRLALLAGLASYAVMSFIMTATPLSMHVHDGFSTAQTTFVITAHLLGMYLPSLVSPWLIGILGVRRMMVIGIFINIVCIGIAAYVGQDFIHYFTALTLLGVGWNLMFVSATAMLATTYEPADRFRAQGFNDLAVFGSQAVTSLLAGTAIETLGWKTLNLVALPLLIFVLLALHRPQKPSPETT